MYLQRSINTVLLKVFVVCLFLGTTQGGIREIGLFPKPWHQRGAYGTDMRIVISHRIQYHAMPVLADQDSTLDPVFVFYDRMNDEGRVLNCPFYRPTDFTYKDTLGREINCWRVDSLGAYRHHWGLDIHAPEGTPIVAADTGIVTYAGPFKRGYLGAPIIYVETFYTFEDTSNPFSLSVGILENSRFTKLLFIVINGHRGSEM